MSTLIRRHGNKSVSRFCLSTIAAQHRRHSTIPRPQFRCTASLARMYPISHGISVPQQAASHKSKTMNGQTLSHARGLFRLRSKCRDSSHNNFCCNSLYSECNPRSSCSSKSIKNTILLATLKSPHCLICIPSVLLCIALPHRVGSVLALFPAQIRETSALSYYHIDSQ